jgi:competence protein ComEC
MATDPPWRTIEINSQPRETARSVSFKGRIWDHKAEAYADLQFYVAKDTGALQLQRGQIIAARFKAQRLESKADPYQFNYAAYLANQGIRYRAYIAPSKWQLLDSIGRRGLLWQAERARRYLVQQIDQTSLEPQAARILKALLLGERSDLPDELREAYAAAGIMHILAVSGMHVGILFLLLRYLLFPLRWSPRLAKVEVLIMLLALWSYAFLTGLSASVVRAATMFSFISLGRLSQRQTNVYNTLLASLLFLLLYRPSYLFDLGFQLSYLAVFGIVWLYQPLMKPFERKPAPLRWLMSIIVVSIAAQSFTTAPSLYYFHRFPGLFLLSNILVVPLVLINMYTGVTFLIFSLAGLPSQWLIQILELSLGAQNKLALFIQAQHSFNLAALYPSLLQSALILALSYFFWTWLSRGGVKHLGLALCSAILILALQLRESADLAKPHCELVKLKEGAALLYSQQGKAQIWWLSREDFATYQDYLIATWRGARNIRSLQIQSDSLNAFTAEGYCSLARYRPNSELPLADYWIIEEEDPPLPDASLSLPKQGIISIGSNKAKLRQWRQWASAQAIEWIDLNEKEYYQIGLTHS